MDTNPPSKPGAPKIQHTQPAIGQPPPPPQPPTPAPPQRQLPMERPISLEPEPVPVVDPTGPTAGGQKIRAFEKKKRHEEEWARTPNTNGTGAIHVKTFHAKLTGDALTYMDQTINEWLDAHPQYEVKFVTTSVGILTGKLKEPNLICQVWV
ncbi:MAG: hypothetical protein GY715_19185 [Planctomycetes bacterium]|nr:hypothetical protein [Planctomycetota bacterium]